MSTTGLSEPTAADLRDALEGVLVPRLTKLLAARTGGHCMRVTEIDRALAANLVRRLRGACGPAAEICLLGPVRDTEVGSRLCDVTVTSTKLVELRNRTEDPDSVTAAGPLLVFVPPGLRASAEDSFGVATFEEVPLGDSFQLLAADLLAELPSTLQTGVKELFALLSTAPDRRADARARAMFLLTVKANGFHPRASGGAVYHLGLVPDFALFEQPAQVRARVTRNRDLVNRLCDPTHSERQRVLNLGLTDPDFTHKLASFAARCGLEERTGWTRRIVVDRENWSFTFENWRLDDRRRATVAIDLKELDLPRAGDIPKHLEKHPDLSAIAGEQYLPAGPEGIGTFDVRFSITPDVRKVEGLARFRVEIVSEKSGSIGRSHLITAGTKPKAEYKATLKKLTKISWEEGWHFIRVTPLDAQAGPLDVEPRGEGLAGGESERFYVVPDAETEEPPERSAGRYEGVAQALHDLRFQALASGEDPARVTLAEARWKAGTGRSPQRALGARITSAGQVDVRLSPTLTALQQRILAEWDRPGLWQLSLGAAGGAELARDAEDGLAASLSGSTADTFTAFLAARRAYFAAIRFTATDSEGSEDDSDMLVTEAVDPASVRGELATYAEAYTELIAAQLRHAERAGESGRAESLSRLAQLLQIDGVAVTHIDGRGQRHRALLLSPTHPLRALWLATWSTLGTDWLDRLADADRRDVIAARGSLLDELSSLGFPFAIPRRDGRLLIAADNLTPYWATYLPSEMEDPRGLLGRLATALGLPSTSATTGTRASGLSDALLADRVERYVRLHPYVRTLVMNVVNAGRGDLLADMLLELQRRETTRELRYDLRLCVGDPEEPEVGDALAELLRAEAQVPAAEAEAFLNPTGGALHPKLAFSVRAVDEFTAHPEDFDAHLTVLIDAFGGEQHVSTRHQDIAHAPAHGLVQAMTSQYAEDEDQITWRTSPRHGEALPLDDAEDLTTLIGRLPRLMSTAAATVATSGQTFSHVPSTLLALNADKRALLYHAHQVSDWVVTVDRTLGLEYFDHARGDGGPEYVIDYAPRSGSSLGHQIMVSSKSVDELRALLGPIAGDHGLDVEQRHLHTFFDQLRLLSGNLAFKLASTSPNQRTEVLGLSLARLYLGYQGVLANQIVVPLDAHPELYRDTRRQVRELGDSLSFQRSDLALFHLDERSRTITCGLVEVKCYTALQDIGAYQQLKAKVAQQLDRSQEVLAASFDPAHTDPGRVDRSVKNLGLASMLRFYLTRAHRHGTMAGSSHDAAHQLLDRLDDGYTLRFTRSGLIFDLARSGTDRELDHGLEFHRIGHDLIEELIDAIPTVRPRIADVPLGDSSGDVLPGEAADDAPTLALRTLSVPRVADAAFRAPEPTSDVAPKPAPYSRVPQNAHTGDSPPANDAADPEVPQSEGLAHAEPSAAGSDGVDESVPTPTLPEESPAASPRQEAAPKPVPAPTIVDPAAAFRSAPTVDATPTPVPSRPASLSATPDAYLGVMRPTPQFGVLGDIAGRTIALDLNETHTISLFGVQGGGKSYTLGSIMEMASLHAPPVNVLPHPLATVVFHYSQTQDYPPEFTSMVHPNDDEAQLRSLRERYGAEPKALQDVLLLAPEAQLDERRRQYPGVDVQPLAFASSELQAGHWRFLMGAVGNQSVYIRQLTRIMRAHRNNLSLAAIRQGVEDSDLPDHLKRLAQERLNLAAEYIDDTIQLTSRVRPGRLIIVDLRDEFIEKDEALGLFVVLMQLFAEARDGDRHFNKLVVFDEAHKYIDSPDLVAGLVETVREMRHKGMSILVASQDPPSVPISLIELSDHIVLHKFTSPAWLKHLQKANAALSTLSSEQMSRLQPGEAYVWASKSTDPAFTHGAVKLRCRPRVTRHGGATKTAGGER
ncbi:methylation-associated defense system ATP-binding protein MAD8 [Streptomyces sp. NPDC055134]